MAQIPTITAPNLTAPPEMNPSIAGQPGRALAGAADQMASAADFGAQVSERIKKAQDEGILLGAENQIAGDIEKAHAGLANWTDYTNADQMKQQTAESLQQKYTDLYGDKPRLWRYIQPYLNKELNSYNGVVDQKAAQLTAHFNKSALDDSQIRAEGEAATEPTLDGKERIWAIQDAKTDVMVRNGTIWADEGEAAKKTLRSRTIATEVDRAANPLNSPEIMEQEMQRLKEYEGKGYVDPKELEQMQDHLATSYERAVTRSDRIDVSRQGDAMLSSLKNDPTLKDPETREFDHMAAAKKIDDDPNVPTKVKKYVRQELEEEAGATNKLTNDNDQKMLDALDPHVESGQLTFAELTRRENLAPGQKDWIPRRVADHLLTRAAQIQRENRVVGMQERGLLRQERMDKSTDMMYDLLSSPGYMTERSELTPYILKGLSKSDAATVWSVKNAGGSKDYADAVTMMRQSSIYPNTDEGHMKLSNDLTKLRQTVDQRKLVGPDILKAAQDIVHPQEEEQNTHTIKGLLDNIWGGAVQAITGVPVIPKTPGATSPERPKGVPDNAVWNEGAKQWQLPQ